jgi:hypothetical protein
LLSKSLFRDFLNAKVARKVFVFVRLNVPPTLLVLFIFSTKWSFKYSRQNISLKIRSRTDHGGFFAERWYIDRLLTFDYLAPFLVWLFIYFIFLGP